jgi:Periplasmic binding protein
MMRKVFVLVVIGTLILSAVGIVGGASPASAAASPATQGVTATSIRVGIPYVDLASVRKFGITLDQGSFPDAYKAIITNLNARGGINGRHLVPYLVAVNPVGTGPAITACTQLSEDDAVFVAIAPQQPDCFLQQHHVPTISGMFQDVESSGGAPNFTLLPPLAAYDPVQLAVLSHHGVFKGKKVGLFAGTETDAGELKVVQTSLKSLGAHVVQSAVDGAPQDDEVATNQQAALIAQRFQQAGVNEVVAVGTGATIWPESLQANESSYLPAWIATSESGLESAVLGSSIAPKYLENVLTTSPVPSNYDLWHTPAVQACDRVVRKAYPSLEITPPTNPLTGSDQTFYAVESACLNIDLFAAIAKAAGKDLTWSSFAHAGYGLRNATIPGSGTPVSFAPGRAYAIGPVYLVTFDRAKNVLQFADSPATK